MVVEVEGPNSCELGWAKVTGDCSVARMRLPYSLRALATPKGVHHVISKGIHYILTAICLSHAAGNIGFGQFLFWVGKQHFRGVKFNQFTQPE